MNSIDNKNLKSNCGTNLNCINNNRSEHESMEFIFFIKGLIIGFAMAVPIGPVGIMCIRKTLAEGHSRGLIIGIGAATADSLFASIAAFGLTFVSDVITRQHLWLGLVGGGLLLFLGMRTFLAMPKDPRIPFASTGVLRSYIYSFFMVITNPVTVFAFVAVFAAFGLGHKLTIISACILVIGVFTGSCLWFLTLGYIAILFRERLHFNGLIWVNKIAGTLIILSGIAAVMSLI